MKKMAIFMLIGALNLVYAASQSNFYGVWARGSTYYEINKDAVTTTDIGNSSIKKAKYRIVKWEKYGDNGYVIYTLSENNSKVSFSVKIDAYSDVFIDGSETKKSSAAEINKKVRAIEADVAAAKKAFEQKIANVQRGSIIDSRDGKNYKTVKIGSQVWMAENLNYETDGSKCYNNEPSNCNIYGHLYDWEMAMKVCPSGWHLPTNDEWDKLYRYIDGSSGTESPYESPTAGRHLKSTSGWSNNEGEAFGNGEDTYGFAILPGGLGLGDSNGGFGLVGNYGYWWSASEYRANYAYSRYMYYNHEGASWDHRNGKVRLYSIRCVQD